MKETWNWRFRDVVTETHANSILGELCIMTRQSSLCFQCILAMLLALNLLLRSSRIPGLSEWRWEPKLTLSRFGVGDACCANGPLAGWTSQSSYLWFLHILNYFCHVQMGWPNKNADRSAAVWWHEDCPGHKKAYCPLYLFMIDTTFSNKEEDR